jgi:orotate phosphoribosyltransferase
MVYPRKEVKDYGTKAAVEGVFDSGDKCVVIDDLITTGDSKFEGFEKLQVRRRSSSVEPMRLVRQRVEKSRHALEK